MSFSLRSAVVPLLFTMGLSAAVILGVEDLARNSRAACDHPLPGFSSATQAQPAMGIPIGAFHLSRFDRSGWFGCQGMRTEPAAAVRQ